MTGGRVVHKITMVSPTTSVLYGLPKWSRIVGAGFQEAQQQFVFWYERNVSEKLQEQWELCIVGTGDPYPADYEYLAAPVVVNGYVFHLVGKKVA